jgi:plastocyanin
VTPSPATAGIRDCCTTLSASRGTREVRVGVKVLTLTVNALQSSGLGGEKRVEAIKADGPGPEIKIAAVMRIAASVCLSILLLASDLPAVRLNESTGIISGAVTLTAARGAPLATSPYGRRGVAPKPSAAGPETRNVVVYLEGLKLPTAPTPMRAEIIQRGERFVPAVTALTVGSSVDFPNADPFFHNVFSLSRAATFDLGRYPSGESRTHQFSRPGVVKVFCHLHSQMTALILVFDHAWFTIPAESGAFLLSRVPAGDHTVVARHERIGERREHVRVTAGATANVNFTLPVLEPER